jgi:DNA repair protein RadC
VWCADCSTSGLVLRTAGPRERVYENGPDALGDSELVALLLGSGTRTANVQATATELVVRAGGLAPLSRASARELAQVIGVGAARATRVVAAFELGRRALERAWRRERIARPEDIYRIVATRLSCLAQERFLVVGMDVRNQLLDVVECARGTVAGVEVHPREVFRPLVRMAAAGGVVVHNHPTGDPTPSDEDVELTRRLRDAGRLIGIPIIDHIVIGDGSFRSIAEWIGTEL